MQKIYLEKSIDLHHHLKELIALSVDESINYKIENEGIRAIGNLIIKGEYKNVEKETFEETLELDILATFDKILDQRDFSIKVEDFDYVIKDGNIKVSIEAGVHGVVSGQDRYIKDDSLEQIESLIREETKVLEKSSIDDIPEVDPVSDSMGDMVEMNTFDDPIEMMEPTITNTASKDDEPLLVNEPTTVKLEKQILPNDAIMSSHNATMEVTEDKKIEKVADDIDQQLQETVYPSKSRPIFQDTSESVGTYYLYIVKDGDTYVSIATHYGVDEYQLKDYNQDRELEIGTVLIVPYVP